MLFNSLEFVVFFAVVYAVYLALSTRGQNVWLLGASYLFYGAWDWRFLGLIWLSTAVDFVVARKIADVRDASDEPRAGRGWLLLSLATNLGLLATFKYFGFFVDSARELAGWAGVELSGPTMHLIVPVGISFYTFQTLSYTIDVYRGTIRPCRRLLDFALFVAFFPQLVAGPIERASVLLPQIENARRIRLRQLREGLWLVLIGFYLKMVLADNLAPFTGGVFDSAETVRDAHGTEIPIALLCTAFQIWGDFAGYSAIARGIAKWMGFELCPNFARPYLAASPSDFWGRWHISLSRWLRDYLYIPLGGNRGGRLLTLRNLMLTMLLGGLWHGPAWHFIAWGGYHGLLLCLYRPFEHRIAESIRTARYPLAKRLAYAIPFFGLTLVGWLLFFIPDVRLLPELAAGVTSPFAVNGRMAALTLLVFAVPVVLLELLAEAAGTRYVVLRWNGWARNAIYAGLLAAILLCGNHGDRTFIYFQF